MKKALIASAVLVLFLSSNGHSGAFNVLPTKVFLSITNKTDNLRVKNEASEAVSIQIKTMEWSQDENGKDVYLPTSDLVYMPRIFAIKGKEERIIRLGYDMKPADRERTFRIYIEEVPQVRPGSDGTSLNLALRMGIPVFIAPGKKQDPRAEIAQATITGGKLKFAVTNLGSTHVFEKSIRISGKDAKGKAEFTEARQGWYVLSGKSRPYVIDIPEAACRNLETLTIEVDLDKLKLNKTIHVDKKSC